ncbi:MAG TPA: hypothetical protein VJU86_22625 [Pyrinomonadaceae bacterium]|nr:hypothetical protein [Pyrinomonadaceae bacterium]
MKYSRSVFIVLLIALALTSVAGQTDLKEKARKEEERKQLLERQTFALVEQIAADTSSLKLPENRLFLLAETAELMWAHDQKRARSIFLDAFNNLTLLTIPSQNKDPKKQRDEILFSTFTLRSELLLRIARRDSQFALDLLRSVAPIPPDLSQRYFLPDLEQQIVAEAAYRDPQLTLKLGREVLAKKLTHEVLNTLFRLNYLDQELGSKFAGEIIAKLQTRDLSSDQVASGIASDLLISSRPPKSSFALGGRGGLKLTGEQRRQLVDMIATAILGLSGNGALLHAVSDIMPEIEEFAPERAALLQRKAVAFNETLNKEQKDWRQFNSLVRNGTPEEILAAAQQTSNSEQRRMLQQQAVVTAVMHNRADSFRNYLENELKDEGVRKDLIDALDAEQINGSVNKGDAEALRKLLSRARLKEQRARSMAELAILLEKKGDHEEALKLLDEAQDLLKYDFSSDTQTNALLALVAAYALVEPARAFAIIEAAIDRANDQITKLLLLDKIMKTGVVKSGEIILRNSGILSEFVMLRYGSALAALANFDFDRTKAIADRLQRNELRIYARKIMAQGLLQQQQLNQIKDNQ